jgi:NADP-dependent 3-hydroxy acid dehydrogenase YdfG
MKTSLESRVAVVIGSSSGMGEATSRAFVAAGARVVLAARNVERLRALARELDGRALACPTDATRLDDVERLVETTLEHYERIDVLAYVAGTNIPDRSLERLTPDTWDMMIATNLTGAYYCTRAVLPTMRRQRDGLIIYVSSGCVQTPDLSGVSYQASKHALRGLAHGTFREERDNGIRTSVIFPGLTDTPLVLKRPVPTPFDVVAKALQPQDVAEACVFVASLPSRACVPELVLLPSRLA